MSKGKALAGLEKPATKGNEDNFALVRRIGQLPAEEWPDERIVAMRQMFGAEARTMGQLAVFLQISHSVGLNPALGEIWLIQTNRGPKTYTGRDGFLKSASRFTGTMYGGIQSAVVYPEDQFQVKQTVDEDGKQVILIHHVQNPTARKSQYPHGAYAIAYDAESRPTFVYRVFEKCAQMKSTYWTKHSDDAIHNRAVAAALRRVVPLGGLMIQGETPIGDPGMAEQFVERSSTAKLKRLSAELMGQDQVDEVEFEELEDDGKPSLEALRDAFEALCAKYQVAPQAVVAFARDTQTVGDDPAEWGKDELIVVSQELEASEGMDVLKAWANQLTDEIENDEERIEIRNRVLGTQDRGELNEILERLLEM